MPEGISNVGVAHISVGVSSCIEESAMLDQVGPSSAVMSQLELHFEPRFGYLAEMLPDMHVVLKNSS